ncbi:serine carboxypeptidase-like 45 [Nymphaea colorata]|nr:serine carboxypeptidase-like 45 [Nymphaea colorata]
MGSTPWRSMVMATLATLLLHLSFPTEVCSSATSDRITRLPGQQPVDFQQFAGYITVGKKRERALFYYFIEAETEPSSKPLVIWFNGGPGCSSVGVGAFTENGPFRPSGNILVRNAYSWNTEANMLYVETPAGVGFSYSRNISDYRDMNDERTARENLAFLRRWLVKFPEYKNRDLFITGESYAGHYIPQLADLLIRANKQQKEFNLKGIALGNPLLEYYTNLNSRAEFLWSHGVISDSTYRIFSRNCTYSLYLSETYRGNVSSICVLVMSTVEREMSKFVDKYDVTLDVCISSLKMQSLVLSPMKMTGKIDVCVEDETVNYFNRKDVQRALHARLAGVSKWEACSSILDYKLLDVAIPTIPLLGSIVKSGIPVLVYSGDQDSVVPLTGSRTQIHGLAARLGLNTTIPYRVWFAGKQVGGWTQVYGDILSFATIRGGSHEAPFSQPQRALVLFKAFLQGKPLPETF